MNWLIILPELYYLGLAAVFFTLAMIQERAPGREFMTALVLALGGLLFDIGKTKLPRMLCSSTPVCPL